MSPLSSKTTPDPSPTGVSTSTTDDDTFLTVTTNLLWSVCAGKDAFATVVVGDAVERLADPQADRSTAAAAATAAAREDRARVRLRGRCEGIARRSLLRLGLPSQPATIRLGG